MTVSLIYGGFLNFFVQSFDISTTVDPGYVISLIRKLLPSDGEHANGTGLVTEELRAEGIVDDPMNLPENGGEAEGLVDDPMNLPENGGEAEAMDSSENHDTLEGQNPPNNYQNEDRSAGEQTWEECGCILWDLAASEDHAQFMVPVIFIIALCTFHMTEDSCYRLN